MRKCQPLRGVLARVDWRTAHSRRAGRGAEAPQCSPRPRHLAATAPVRGMLRRLFEPDLAHPTARLGGSGEDEEVALVAPADPQRLVQVRGVELPPAHPAARFRRRPGAVLRQLGAVRIYGVGGVAGTASPLGSMEIAPGRGGRLE
jgi:hypothetical protein